MFSGSKPKVTVRTTIDIGVHHGAHVHLAIYRSVVNKYGFVSDKLTENNTFSYVMYQVHRSLHFSFNMYLLFEGQYIIQYYTIIFKEGNSSKIGLNRNLVFP